MTDKSRARIVIEVQFEGQGHPTFGQINNALGEGDYEILSVTPEVNQPDLTLAYRGISGETYLYSATRALGDEAAASIEAMPLGDRVLLRSACKQVLMAEAAVRRQKATR